MISIIDIIISVMLLLSVLIIALINSKGLTLDAYWANKRQTSKFILVCSLLSTSVGAGTVVAMVSASYKGGLIGAVLGFCNALGLFVLGRFFAAKIRKISFEHKCHTMGDILELRFTRRCRYAIALVNLFVYFFFLAAQILAFGAFITVFTELNYMYSIVVAFSILIFYVSVGGLRSDFLTDVFQFFLILALVIILPVFLLTRFGSIISIYNSLKFLPLGYLTGTSYAGLPFLIGAILLFTPSVMVMMDTWQRIFAAKNEETAKKSLILSGVLIFPLFTIFSLIGTISYILFPQIDPNTATPYIIMHVLPRGIMGIAFSGFIAALMSTADSMLIVASATFVKDFYHKLLYRKANDNHLLKVSRVASFLIGFISLGFALTFPDIVGLVIKGFSSLIILLPAVIGGLLWRRATSTAALGSILASFIFVIFVIISFPQYSDYAFIPGFALSSIIFIVISLFTHHSQTENKELWYEK